MITNDVKIVPSVIMKHANKITKTVSNARPVLKGVFHDADGSMTVTNSYYLWRVENAHAYPSPIIIDPVTMQPIDGNYPETKGLIPDPADSQAKWELALDKYTIGMLKALREVGRYSKGGGVKKKDKVIVKIEGGTISLYDSNVTAKVAFWENNPGVVVHLNVTYLINTLEWLADELGDRATIPVYYYGEYRPILLYHERAKALIMSVRVTD